MIKLEQKLNYTFQNPELLKQAITHKSYSNENKLNFSYDRLEYLGDTVLQLVVSDYLIDHCPKYDEGELSKHRRSFVSERSLAIRARSLNIGENILLGKGETATNGADKDSILSDVMESIIGAIYKDNGLDSAQQFIYEHILNYEELPDEDFKTKLQEVCKNRCNELCYETVNNEMGFSSTVIWHNHHIGRGYGKSKKAAEQKAAEQALKNLNLHF